VEEVEQPPLVPYYDFTCVVPLLNSFITEKTAKKIKNENWGIVEGFLTLPLFLGSFITGFD